MPDYAALAKQAGAIESQPAGGGVDYAALAKQAGAVESQPAAPRSMLGGIVDSATEFAKGVGSQINPLTMVQGLADMTAHPIDTARTILQNQANTGQAAVDSFKQGNYLDAARHGAAYLIPVLGPQIDEMGNKAANGQLPRALGEATGFGLANALPGSPTGTALMNRARVSLPALGRTVNPKVAAAVEFGQRRSIPVSAGIATQNKAVQGAQMVADHSPGGAFVAAAAKKAEGEGFTRVLGELADEAHPTAMQPNQAATDTRSAITRTIEGHHAEADRNYSALRDIEADPANQQTVQVGTKEVPILDAQSNPTGRTRQEPVMEEMATPVDLRLVQKQLKPVYDQITRNMSISKRRMSDGLQAIENIMNARWHEPASIIDTDLGVIKAAARGADLPELKTLSQGLAAHAVKALDEQVKAAVGKLKAYDTAPAAVPAAATAPEALARTGTDGGPRPTPAGTSRPPAAVQSGAAPTVGTTETRVTVPGESQSYQARYEVRELGDVKASHKGENFEPNPKYGLKNERNYQSGENQQKVVDWSTEEKFDPSYHVTDNPDAVNGPLVLDGQGNVLGGNGRKMILDRVFKTGKEGAGKYRASLEAKAGQFGIDPESIKGMKQPVLVRVIDDAEFTGGKTKANAIGDFNKTGTADLTPGERAIADSRRVSSGTLDDLAGRIESKGEAGTLAQALEGTAGTDVLQKLIDDGVITPQQRAALATKDGLTPAGKARISELMVGRFFKDPAMIDGVAPAIRDKVTRIAAPAATTEAKAGWSLTPHVQDALEIVQSAKAQGVSLADYFQQGGLLGEQAYNPRAVTLAKHLEGMKPTELTAKVRQYAQDATHAEGGATMFGDPPTPAQSFADAFGGEASSYADGAAPARNGPKFGNMADFDKPAPLPPPRATKSVGSQALAHLKEGRAATVAKYEAADVLKQLREEPRQLYEQTIYAKDSGVELLKKAAKLAPAEMPKIGRALLEDLLDTATKEGGFDKQGTLFTKWKSIGPETKQILFKNPMHVKDLDNFFLLAKKSAELINPSGSTAVLSFISGMGIAFMNPVTGVPMLVGGVGLAKLLHSPKAVAALTRGFTVKAGTGARALIETARIAKLAGDAARPATKAEATRLEEAGQLATQ